MMINSPTITEHSNQLWQQRWYAFDGFFYGDWFLLLFSMNFVSMDFILGLFWLTKCEIIIYNDKNNIFFDENKSLTRETF